MGPSIRETWTGEVPPSEGSSLTTKDMGDTKLQASFYYNDKNISLRPACQKAGSRRIKQDEELDQCCTLIAPASASALGFHFKKLRSANVRPVQSHKHKRQYQKNSSSCSANIYSWLAPPAGFA